MVNNVIWELRSKRRMADTTSDFAMMRVNFPFCNPLNSASSSNHYTIVSRFCRQPSAPQSFIVSARVSHLHESLGRANQASIFLSSFPGPGRKSLIRKLTGSSPVGLYWVNNWRSSAIGLPSRLRWTIAIPSVTTLTACGLGSCWQASQAFADASTLHSATCDATRHLLSDMR